MSELRSVCIIVSLLDLYPIPTINIKSDGSNQFKLVREKSFKEIEIDAIRKRLPRDLHLV